MKPEIKPRSDSIGKAGTVKEKKKNGERNVSRASNRKSSERVVRKVSRSTSGRMIGFAMVAS
jgi:hypothetical protein